jgi:RNA polymerase sigma factor (sigma-70 family)
MEATRTGELVSRAREGDRDAWELLVTEYSSLLEAVARRFLSDEAQRADVVQTIWLRLFEHLCEIRDPERLAGWLLTTATRTCIEALRRTRREEPVGFEDDTAVPANLHLHREADETCPLRNAVDRQHGSMVRRALAELPEPHRRLMCLLFSTPTPNYREVSEMLGMPVGSIGPTRSRILARMRTTLAASGLHDMRLT